MVVSSSEGSRVLSRLRLIRKPNCLTWRLRLEILHLHLAVPFRACGLSHAVNRLDAKCAGGRVELPSFAVRGFASQNIFDLLADWFVIGLVVGFLVGHCKFGALIALV